MYVVGWVIYSFFDFLNRESLLILYYSLVYSHIYQSIVIWAGASENNIKSIRVVVNRIPRKILQADQDDHNIPGIVLISLCLA